MKRLFLGFMLMISVLIASADEGMWIPMLVDSLNIEDMQKKGLKLSADDLYSINHTSIKDAIVIFGGGCTGELISDEGLLITNHHCGYSYIQRHSSVDRDFLSNGFWAMSKDEELSNPGLTVTFLVRMEDVTGKVMKGVTDTMDYQVKMQKIEQNIKKLKQEAENGTHYKAVIKPFFQGNQYFMFINEVYKDVRLVGTPPDAIGKFGGDTDNWMWPRHTGDFSLFRIYADKDNNPAEYSPDNVPYKPKKYLPISLKGVKKGDFTMVYGYPGTTQEYLPSYAVKLISQVENPNAIELREGRLEIMRKYMEQDQAIRIQYASKYARVANYWKKWIGENRGLKKLNAIEKKQAFENDFQNWVNANTPRKEKYGNLLDDYARIYSELEPARLALTYIYEAGYGVELTKLTRKFNAFIKNYTESEDNKDKEKLISSIKGFFKDYYKPIDKESSLFLLSEFAQNVPQEYLPDIFTEIEKSYKSDYKKYIDDLFENSLFANKDELINFVENYNEKKQKVLEKDAMWKYYLSIVNSHMALYLSSMQSEGELAELNQKYMKAIMEMNPDKVYYPDANFTLRIAYGQVDDYKPRDGVEYRYYTTLKGIIEKDNPEIFDYDVPDKLKELYQKKDYGRYGEEDYMPVCFTASNHTTGGNSGSPVINGNGELIGVNFDRNLEGTMSDIMYDPDQCRNITLDIRYALFIIDKFAGAGHLVDEMTIIE